MRAKSSVFFASGFAAAVMLAAQAYEIAPAQAQTVPYGQPTKRMAIELSGGARQEAGPGAGHWQPPKRAALRPSSVMPTAAAPEPRYGLPNDFPALFDQGGIGANEDMKQTCVGGMTNRETTRANISRTPVVLVHGNLGSALHPTYGWKEFIKQLYAIGYTPAEVWAVSYLGYTDSTPDWLKYVVNMAPDYSSNIEDVRLFIDAVLEYTGCPKVDIIGHSLGGGMARGYLYGLDSSDTVETNLNRFDRVSTLTTIAAGNYGMGPMAFIGPFSDDWADSHFNENPEATPYGPLEAEQRTVDSDGVSYPQWTEETSTDSGQITYVAITSVGDAVDLLGRPERVSRLDGANLNYLYKSGMEPVDAHLEAIRAPEIIDVLTHDAVISGGYLNRQPCSPAASARMPTGPVTRKPSARPQGTFQFAF
jgi:pimeloyl-ACP methyl ester carboxylesterase